MKYSPLELAEHVIVDLAQWVKAGVPLTAPERRAARLAICEECPHRDGRRCGKCGCFISARTWWATASCPDAPARWEAVTSGNLWFFQDPAKVHDLHIELESWRGTPYAHQTGDQAAKGVATDCVSFAGAVLINLGAIKPFDWPPYVTHGGGAPMLDLLRATLAGIPGLALLGGCMPTHLMPGDIILVSNGRTGHHLAIFSGDNTVWHSLRRGGVQTGNVQDPTIRAYVQGVYRVKV